MPNECTCSLAPRLIFPCSGAADVGAITDQAGRRLTVEGAGKMFCLAGVGGRVPGIMKTTAAAERIVAVDGCPLDCAKRCLELAGFTRFDHLQLADLGLEKGSAPVCEEAVEKVCAKARAMLTRDR